MTSVFLYARYSTAMQSQASVEDQFRLLRQHAEREGWTIVGQQADRAISGTVRDRPGLNAAIAAIDDGSASILLAESLDRISRDQEDLAGLFKRIKFAGADIVTASEGKIGTIHIGMGGTMSALFLEQLADKVRRGQVGRVKAGRIPGGLSFGYRMVRKFGADGEPERGLREIDRDQAAIVRRIFEEYVAGKGPAMIARQLNAEGIPSPRGGLWRANAIIGSRKRANGILHNRLYIGEIRYNRQTFRKDPESRKRVSRPNAPGDVVCQDIPELRIIDRALWERAQAKLADYAERPAHTARRKVRLFSGLLQCGDCGGPVVIISTDRWGCSAYRQTGTCANRATIKDDLLQARIWDAIRHNLLHPDVIAAYLDEFRQAWAGERRKRIAARARFDRQLREIDLQEERIADAIMAGIGPASLKARADKLAQQRSELAAQMVTLPDVEPMVAHPAMIEDYRRQIGDLSNIAADDRAAAEQARPLLQQLIEFVAVHPRKDGKRGADLVLHGDLANLMGMANPAQSTPAPEGEDAGKSMLKLVAGVGFEPTTFRL